MIYVIRLEVGAFVRESCAASNTTLQIFVSCGGLPVLVSLLQVRVYI